MSAGGDDRFSLSGKTFLITGGTRGIGLAISLRFARSGATVIANYLRDEKAAEHLKAIAAEEGLAIVLCRADLTNKGGLEQLDRSIQERGVQLSGLIHCAATGVHRPIEELTERHLDWTFNLNVGTFFKLVKLLMARFSKGSSIVAVSSWGALRVLPCYSLVGSSKGALEALARHFAAELAPRGIRVNILTAGAVLTDAWRAMPNSEARLAETIRRTPAGRLVTAEEVAYGAQFLCSDAAAGVIGHTLVIDGGTGIMG
ncbi:MAG: SDR family oxidoreductase [Candidatus Acidiferrales bacterium]|jgi:enoyl-[acyl-carrier protein] reductase III